MSVLGVLVFLQILMLPAHALFMIADEDRWKADTPESAAQQPGTVIIGGDQSYPPYEFIDENGEAAGLNVDITKAIANEMGVDMVFRLGPWSLVQQGLLDGSVDLIQGMLYSPQRSREYNFSPHYTVISYIAVGKETPPDFDEDPWNYLAGYNVAVQEGDIIHEYALEHMDSRSIHPHVDQKSVMLDLAEGNVDYALVARLTALYWISELELNGLYPGTQSLLEANYSFAAAASAGYENFSETSDTLLYTFSEGLSAIYASGVYQDIYQHWYGVYDPDFVGEARLKRYLLRFGAPVLMILLLALVWNRMLTRKVRQRTKELKEDNRKRALVESQLSESLKEKNALLFETHHRVKNNMAVICSLLQLQSSKIADKELAVEMLQAERRIRTLSLVHELVYTNQNLHKIRLDHFVPDLIALLKDHFHSFSDDIRINQQLEPLYLKLDQAIPAAMILQELLSNAYQHIRGSVETKSIHIAITLEKSDYSTDSPNDTEYFAVVRVQDSGSGPHDMSRIKEPDTLGYTIINGLANQIRAELSFDSADEGFGVQFRFAIQD